jgi:hypothetical protein
MSVPEWDATTYQMRDGDAHDVTAQMLDGPRVIS